tara:strand:+ start:1457 stop:3190 length:1734 start_codon:yes stop_codon:yes gene_type:complete
MKKRNNKKKSKNLFSNRNILIALILVLLAIVLYNTSTTQEDGLGQAPTGILDDIFAFGEEPDSSDYPNGPFPDSDDEIDPSDYPDPADDCMEDGTCGEEEGEEENNNRCFDKQDKANSNDCTDPKFPHCWASEGRCVECIKLPALGNINGDCGFGEYCSMDRICVDGCMSRDDGNPNTGNEECSSPFAYCTANYDRNPNLHRGVCYACIPQGPTVLNEGCTIDKPNCVNPADKPFGFCTECYNNNDCSDPTPICNTEYRKCAVCEKDSDCSNGATCSILSNGEIGCYECNSDSDCEGNSNGDSCDITTNKCVDVTSCSENGDADCSDPYPICDTDGLFDDICVHCLDDKTISRDRGCGANAPNCYRPDVGGITALGFCAECTDNLHCAGNSGGDKCNQNLNKCGECEGNSDCEDGEICKEINDKIQCTRCITNNDCGSDLICIPKDGQNICAPCIDNRDCGEGNFCLQNDIENMCRRIIYGCSVPDDTESCPEGMECKYRSARPKSEPVYLCGPIGGDNQACGGEGDSNCPNGQVCSLRNPSEGICVPEFPTSCTKPGDCPSGTTCIDGSCKYISPR